MERNSFDDDGKLLTFTVRSDIARAIEIGNEMEVIDGETTEEEAGMNGTGVEARDTLRPRPLGTVA